MDTKLPTIIGWSNPDEEIVLCDSCFKLSYKDKDIKFVPLKKEEGEENMYVCDNCGKKF